MLTSSWACRRGCPQSRHDQVHGAQTAGLRPGQPHARDPPEEGPWCRDDIIMATGRTDYPNQVNNVLCFPYIFRGALDAGASTITVEMEIAAVHAIAELARPEQSEVVAAAYVGEQLALGPNT